MTILVAAANPTEAAISSDGYGSLGEFISTENAVKVRKSGIWVYGGAGQMAEISRAFSVLPKMLPTNNLPLHDLYEAFQKIHEDLALTNSVLALAAPGVYVILATDTYEDESDEDGMAPSVNIYPCLGPETEFIVVGMGMEHVLGLAAGIRHANPDIGPEDLSRKTVAAACDTMLGLGGTQTTEVVYQAAGVFPEPEPIPQKETIFHKLFGR